MKNLDYRIKTSIVLSCEDYTNAGLRQEDMMKAVEKINGVWMVAKYPINRNIEVDISFSNRDDIKELVKEIRWTFEMMLDHQKFNCG